MTTATIITVATVAIALFAGLGWWNDYRSKRPYYEAWAIGLSQEGYLRVQYRITASPRVSEYLQSISTLEPISILTDARGAHYADHSALPVSAQPAQKVVYERRIEAGAKEGGSLMLAHQTEFTPGQPVSFRFQTRRGAKTLKLFVPSTVG